MVIPRFLIVFLKRLGWIAAGILFFVVNMILLWNFSGIRYRVKIENGSSVPVFQVVVMESGKAQLFLLKEDLDDYLRTHSNYSFLIPAGQDQLVQDQIVASYNARFGINGGKGYPTFKRQALDANHQYIELYMHGDPHDDVFWYEATDKTIEPKYFMVFSAFHLLFMMVLAIGMTAIECWLAVRILRAAK
jgi:hypothetical protein